MFIMASGTACLREWSPEDGAWYAAQLSDEAIQRFTTEQASTTAQDFRAALERLNSRSDQAGFAIVDPATGELAGNMAAERRGDGTVEVSYWVAAGFRGRGLAGDALMQMRRWIAAHWRVTQIVLWTHAENIASRRAAEKGGFRYASDRDEVKIIDGRAWPACWYTYAIAA